MKKFFLYAIGILPLTGLSQDPAKLKQIDSIVNVINRSNYTIQKDTIRQDPSQIGMTIVKYLTMMTDGPELKKYVTDVQMTTAEESPRKINGTVNFYFNHNQLIKVEEFMVEGGEKKDLLWYFADGKPIHYTLNNERSQERAETLLAIAKTMLEKFGSK